MELLSVTMNDGVVKRSQIVGKDNSSEDKSNYKIVRSGDLVYNSMRMWQGANGISKYDGIVSPAYTVLKAVEEIDEGYFAALFKTVKLINECHKNSQGLTSDTWNLKYPQIAGIRICVPKLSEQHKISSFLRLLDKRIDAQRRLVEALKSYKRGALTKLFPQGGGNVPEYRFAGFTGEWEQRKFQETVIIERGGSPRPIENFITEAENGLNWVKIGDAPAMGNYITKTAEKIRPEGLHYTREVHPGDLILSNSMSFGKPYIMGINGCIHDGWLLIRNENDTYDLDFLCHLLGAKHMLDQYKSLAAGSAVNNLNKELVGSTIVSYPGIQEQKAIGNLLTSLDSLIALHQKNVVTYEKVKHGLIQELFI